MKEFDADPNILVIIAHDSACSDIFDFFPTGTLNDWHLKSWKNKHRWAFLNEMPYHGEVRKSPIVDGLYQGQERLRGLDVSCQPILQS